MSEFEPSQAGTNSAENDPTIGDDGDMTAAFDAKTEDPCLPQFFNEFPEHGKSVIEETRKAGRIFEHGWIGSLVEDPEISKDLTAYRASLNPSNRQEKISPSAVWDAATLAAKKVDTEYDQGEESDADPKATAKAEQIRDRRELKRDEWVEVKVPRSAGTRCSQNGAPSTQS